MKLLIVNGPNLNLIGKREPAIYGNTDFEDWFRGVRNTYAARNVALEYRQSNIEGELIDFIQAADGIYDGVILNAGGYTHTSVAIADAIRAVEVPVVEVHISNIFAREEYRRLSLTGAACRGAVTGFGLDSYLLAIESFLRSR
jgi:3-dehydroquinate dehydratase-2